MNKAEAEQLQILNQSEGAICPTCGGPMKEDTPERGGKHTLMGTLTNTNYPGYRQLKPMQKIAGG